MEPSLDLYATPGDWLDTFLRDNLQPQWDWKEEMQDAWCRIERFFRDHCFHNELILDQEVKVLKVVKGGSSGKGTTLNYRSDQDMVLFLSCFSSFEEQALHREAIIDFIEEKLARCRKSLAYNITVVEHRKGRQPPRSLTLQVQSNKSSDIMYMDILPAYDALGPFCPLYKPAPEIYEDLIRSQGQPGEFSSCFTELQRYFVKNCPVKLKNLLQLVKFWYLQYVRRRYQQALPPKYALELLTIYAWEMGTEKSDNFNLDEGLVAVMELLRDYKDICIYWTKYYDFQNEVVRDCVKQQLKECRPVILDPADPTNNLGRKKGWDVVAKEAAICLRQACCMTEDPNQRWHVQRARDVQVTVKQAGRDTWTLLVNPYNPIWKMKAEIRRINAICGEQRISFQEPGGNRQLLSSQKTLADYGIFSKVNIRVLETFPPQIQIFVKDSSGQSKPYAILPDNTIRDLKEVIEEAGGPYVEDQILKFSGQRLRDHLSLADMQIEDCDTIQLLKKS